MSDIVISVSNISKCYQVFDDQRSKFLHAVWPTHTKGMQEIWALKNVNFEIKRGEAVAIIGRNGGGKSTLLQILTGTLTPTTGEVKINGRVSALLELGSGFNPEYSGRDNVILNGLLLGLSREDIINRFDEIEAFAEIGTAIDRPVKTYSSGMMMRLAFAVQVLSDPDILIIDEALSVGDFFFQQKCLGYIRKLNESGVTLLFVSHDMGAVRDVCRRGIFVNTGFVEYDGDNLGAILRYLNQPKTSPSIKNHPSVNKIASDKFSINIQEPFWSIDINNIESQPALIMAIGIFDENGNPIASARMGSQVRVRVQYKYFYDDQPHVHLIIKNKYDQIVTAFGSFNLKIQVPTLTPGSDAIFEFLIQMSLEAGEYVFRLCLTRPLLGTGGSTIDETPWLGPFAVVWNYHDNIPPFYGLAGMNSSGRFLLDTG